MSMGIIPKSFSSALNKHRQGAIILMELPEEHYFEANTSTIKLLIKKGYEGIYVSFHRPFKNISSLFTKAKVNINKLIFIDVASSVHKENGGKNPRCVRISPEIDIDELVSAIYTSLPKLKSRKRFIFIDSLNTITLYKNLSDVMRFAEFLSREVENHEVWNVILIFNVAKGLSQQKFIKDIAIRVHEVVNVT